MGVAEEMAVVGLEAQSHWVLGESVRVEELLERDQYLAEAGRVTSRTPVGLRSRLDLVEVAVGELRMEAVKDLCSVGEETVHFER